MRNMSDLFVPSGAREHLGSYGMQKMLDRLLAPGAEFGDDPIAGRDSVLLASLVQAVDGLRQKLGSNMERWQYGQEAYQHAYIAHPFTVRSKRKCAVASMLVQHPEVATPAR